MDSAKEMMQAMLFDELWTEVRCFGKMLSWSHPPSLIPPPSLSAPLVVTVDPPPATADGTGSAKLYAKRKRGSLR